MSQQPNITVHITINGDVNVCRKCSAKPARNNDTRCHRCASPARYGKSGAIRGTQTRKYRKACATRIEHGICEFCNKRSATLEVDHVNGNHADDRPENFQVLCPSCHKEKSRRNGDYCKRKAA